MEISIPDRGLASVYLDYGKGFTEEQRWNRRIGEQSVAYLRFKIPATGWKRLRFDPTQKAGRIDIGKVLWRSPVSSAWNRLSFEGSDIVNATIIPSREGVKMFPVEENGIYDPMVIWQRAPFGSSWIVYWFRVGGFFGGFLLGALFGVLWNIHFVKLVTLDHASGERLQL